jgi:hypothetical protein
MQVLLLAIYAALYPTLLAIVVVLLSQQRRLPLLTGYLCGGLTISIVLGLALIFTLKGSGTLHDSRSGLSWTADLAIGVAALIAAIVLATHADARLADRRRAARPAPPSNPVTKEPWSQRVLARGSVPVVFVAALVINLPGAAYLIALKDIAAAHHPTAEDVALVVAFNLMTFLFAEIPLLGLLLAPERTIQLVQHVNSWFSANGRRVAITLCAALSIYLIARGIVHS